MPPQTRSNCAEELTYQRMAALGLPINTVGLPALPDELLLLIVSFFPTCRIPEETGELPDNGLAPRHITLLVLTMTCRALRRVCLPLLWQRIEARAGMEGVDNVIATHGGQHWTKEAPNDKGLERDILRQLETVTIREPKYATYVDVVDLDIMCSFDTPSLLRKVLNSLERFPRLHTIRLKTPCRQISDILSAHSVVYSWNPKAPLASIKRYYSNMGVSRLIQSCPNVHTAGGLLSDPIHLSFLKVPRNRPMEAVEKLENVSAAVSSVKMTEFAPNFPNLRHIGMDVSLRFHSNLQAGHTPFGMTLAAFQKLDSIEFQLDAGLWADDDSWRDELCSGPIAVLKGIQARDRRAKTFRLIEAPSGPTRRAYSFVLPLRGVPEWTESFVDVVP